MAYILHEVLAALEYLHGENRIHRDIKAANILLGPTGVWGGCARCADSGECVSKGTASSARAGLPMSCWGPQVRV